MGFLVLVLAAAGLLFWPQIKPYAEKAWSLVKQKAPGVASVVATNEENAVARVERWQSYYDHAKAHGCPDLVKELENLFPHNLHGKDDHPAQSTEVVK